MLTFHKRMSIVTDTLSRASTHLDHFLFVIFLVSVGSHACVRTRGLRPFTSHFCAVKTRSPARYIYVWLPVFYWGGGG